MERTGGKGKGREDEGRECKKGAGEGRGGRKGRDKGKENGRGNWCPPHDLFALCPCQYITNIAAAEKCPLSYQTPQSVHMDHYGAQTLQLTMHYGGKKVGENRERNGQILTPNELDLTFSVPDYGAKFWQN